MHAKLQALVPGPRSWNQIKPTRCQCQLNLRCRQHRHAEKTQQTPQASQVNSGLQRSGQPVFSPGHRGGERTELPWLTCPRLMDIPGAHTPIFVLLRIGYQGVWAGGRGGGEDEATAAAPDATGSEAKQPCPISCLGCSITHLPSDRLNKPASLQACKPGPGSPKTCNSAPPVPCPRPSFIEGKTGAGIRTGQKCLGTAAKQRYLVIYIVPQGCQYVRGRANLVPGRHIPRPIAFPQPCKRSSNRSMRSIALTSHKLLQVHCRH